MIPGSQLLFCPKIYVTVIAHSPFLVSRGPAEKVQTSVVGVFFSGFLGRMVRGAGGERVGMVEGEGEQYVKPVL